MSPSTGKSTGPLNIKSLWFNMHDIKKIALLRALQLGDFLCVVPAIRALRTFYPHAHISWIGLPGNEHLQKRFAHYLDEFICFPGYPGLPEQAIHPKTILSFMQDMEEKSFDLVLQMQGNGTYVNELVTLFSARYCAGFYLENNFRPNNDYFIPYPAHLHEIDRHLALMNHLNIATIETDLEFPFFPDSSLMGAKLNLAQQSYVCIHPGSRGSWRQWAPENFAKVADYCMELGYHVVLTGSKEEVEIANRVAKQMKFIPFILTGQTNLDEMATLLTNAKALIANCTGVAHMAYALNTPSVIISMDGEPFRWAPKNDKQQMIDWLETPDYSLVLHMVEKVILRNL